MASATYAFGENGGGMSQYTRAMNENGGGGMTTMAVGIGERGTDDRIRIDDVPATTQAVGEEGGGGYQRPETRASFENGGGGTNQYGDPSDMVYGGGNPTFNESTGKYQEYIGRDGTVTPSKPTPSDPRKQKRNPDFSNYGGYGQGVKYNKPETNSRSTPGSQAYSPGYYDSFNQQQSNFTGSNYFSGFANTSSTSSNSGGGGGYVGGGMGGSRSSSKLRKKPTRQEKRELRQQRELDRAREWEQSQEDQQTLENYRNRGKMARYDVKRAKKKNKGKKNKNF